MEAGRTVAVLLLVAVVLGLAVPGGAAGAASADASIVVEDADVSDLVVGANETVTISATVINDGSSWGSAMISFEANDAPFAERTVGLDAGESTDLTVTERFEDPGDYEISINGEHVETVSVAAPDPAELEVQSAYLTRTTIDEGETIDSVAELRNVGEEDGTFEVSVAIDDEEIATATETIEAGDTTEIRFSHTFDTPGEYEVTIGDRSAGTVTVRELAGSIRVLDATLIDEEIDAGESAIVAVDVENPEELPAEQDLAVTVDGDPVASESVSLEGVERADIEIEFEPTEGGTVAVDRIEAGTLTVQSSGGSDDESLGDDDPETVIEIPGFTIGIVGVMLAVVAVVGRVSGFVRR